MHEWYKRNYLTKKPDTKRLFISHKSSKVILNHIGIISLISQF